MFEIPEILDLGVLDLRGFPCSKKNPQRHGLRVGQVVFEIIWTASAIFYIEKWNSTYKIKSTIDREIKRQRKINPQTVFEQLVQNIRFEGGGIKTVLINCKNILIIFVNFLTKPEKCPTGQNQCTSCCHVSGCSHYNYLNNL